MISQRPSVFVVQCLQRIGELSHMLNGIALQVEEWAMGRLLSVTFFLLLVIKIQCYSS